MSIEKLNPRLLGETVPFTLIDSRVVQGIDNPDLLAVWTYLLTLPPDWIVVKKHLKEKFGYGGDKLKQIFCLLKKHCLIEYVRSQDERGAFIAFDIRVLNGSRFIETVEFVNKISVRGRLKDKTHELSTENTACGISPPVDNTTGGISPPLAEPTGGLQDTTDKTLLTEETKKQREAPPHQHSLLFFEPTDATLEAAAAKGLDLAYVRKKFEQHNKNKPKFSCTWPKEFEIWVKRERPEYNEYKNNTNYIEPKRQTCTIGPVETPEENQRNYERRMLELGYDKFGQKLSA